MKKAFFLCGALLAAFLIPLSALQAAELPEKLGITYVKAPLNIPSILEKKLELFEKKFGPQGIEVTYPELTAGPQQTAGMASGAVSFANCIGGTSVLLAAANGLDIKIIGIYGRAPRAFVILVKDPALKNVRDLKGKKIAGPKGTILHQLLVSALEREGLASNNVDFLGMGLMEGITALLRGSVDACLAAGPGVLKAQKEGARVLVNGTGLVDGLTLMAARKSFIEQYPHIVKDFLAVDAEARDFMTAHPEEALAYTAEATGLTPEEVAQMAPLYDFSSSIASSDVKDLEKTQEFLYENGMLPQKVSIEKLFSPFSPNP
ncbi:MAG TPA: aliphatic sulfonate ABC transporter substrate-binding protein [Synergistaceae bacterium]|nr:aliphatic sulfonate ABC transporter substrate-binding protein [Synergistaceae bacterium]